jgi:hypothetical protein
MEEEMEYILIDATNTYDQLLFETNLDMKDVKYMENEIRKFQFQLKLIKFGIRRAWMHYI